MTACLVAYLLRGFVSCTLDYRKPLVFCCYKFFAHFLLLQIFSSKRIYGRTDDYKFSLTCTRDLKVKKKTTFMPDKIFN